MELYGVVFLAGSLVMGCTSGSQAPSTEPISAEVESNQSEIMKEAGELDTATFGAGCFWCVEAVFQELNGVKKVVSGYAGGFIKNPSYKEVCSGRTGHAEVAQITFDPSVITYDELLEVFWQTHDPTTLNRQGNDVGTQYRSSVFYHNQAQKDAAAFYKDKLDQSGAYNGPIVTTLEPLTDFYEAEDYHQNYYNNNASQPYCAFVVKPKVDKVRKVFADKLAEKKAE